MDGFSEVRARTSSPAIRALIDLFEDLRQEVSTGRPQKADFDPTMLRMHLGKTILYSVEADDDIVFRITGEKVRENLGVNPKDRSYMDFVPEFRRDCARAAFLVCANTPCAMYVRTEQVFSNGVHKQCEALGVPLFSDEAERACNLLFIDDVVSDVERLTDMSLEFMYAYLRERSFIDIGFGTPASFIDKVPAHPESYTTPEEMLSKTKPGLADED